MTNDFSHNSGATGRVTIDLGQIATNWQALATFVRPAECAAVVKADAYGLGADRVIPVLAKAGCATFFVATANEAEQARALVRHGVIYVLDGVVPGSAQQLIAVDARPVLANIEDAREWVDACTASGRRARAGLQIDTGLNRLGLGAADIEALVGDGDLMPALDLTLVMSHLASADVNDDPMNGEQLRAFHRLKALLPKTAASLAASDGLQIGPEFHFDLVRPGYALYGGQASLGRRAPVKCVVKAEAMILQVRNVPAGETVGYSAAWKAERLVRVATVAAGYADGVARSASATNMWTGGMFAIGGILAPIIGRVSMDLITIDVTGFSAAEADRGTFVELIGPNLPLEQVGAFSGSIGYEVLTRLGRRFERVYVDGLA